LFSRPDTLGSQGAPCHSFVLSETAVTQVFLVLLWLEIKGKKIKKPTVGSELYILQQTAWARQ
jgi:hypothetical protein